MQTFCQILLIAWLLLNFFVMLDMDFYGRKARAPYGYAGAVTTVLITALLFAVFAKAGAFSNLF